MIEVAALLLGGVLLWTFVEYLIHGWLSHTFHTFAGPLHAVHHRNPAAVFTIGAWVPLAVVWIVLVALFRWEPGVMLYSATLGGFIAYEVIHYRFHFCLPRGRIESYLRSRHLAHHECHPARCFGVTSPMWDLVFGTELRGVGLLQSVATTAPSSGRTNLYKLTDIVRWRPSRHW